MNELPGLKSVASAIAAPASTRCRAGGIGRSRKSALAGSRTPTTSLDASAAIAVRPGRLEVVDRAGAELDRKRDRAALGELIAVEPQREAGRAARLEVAAGLQPRRTRRVRERRRRRRRASTRPAAPRRAPSRGKRPRPGARGARRGRPARSGNPPRSAPPEARRAPSRGRDRSPTFPPTRSCRAAASSPRDVRRERSAPPRRARASRQLSTGCRRRPPGAPRRSRRPSAARTPRRGHRRTPDACGSRRGPGPRSALDRRSPRRHRPSGPRSRIRPTDSMTPSSQRT